MKKIAAFVSMLFPHGRDDEEDRQRARGEDYRRLFASTLGRRVMADILREGGLFTAHAGRFDDRSLTLLEGRRWLALDIFDLAGGTRDRLGQAMTRDHIGEALDEPDTRRASGASPAADAASDPAGEPGEPLFAARPDAAALLDGD